MNSISTEVKYLYDKKDGFELTEEGIVKIEEELKSKDIKCSVCNSNLYIVSMNGRSLLFCEQDQFHKNNIKIDVDIDDIPYVLKL